MHATATTREEGEKICCFTFFARKIEYKIEIYFIFELVRKEYELTDKEL
jgi:hypothetical protein